MPSFLTSGLDARRTEYQVADGNVWQVWELHPHNPTGKTVVAVHGGGFVLQPTLLHWTDYTDMARDTGATVIVPLYPLATTGSARTVVPAMAQFISHQMDRYGAADVSALHFEDEVFAALPTTTIYVGSLERSLPDTLLLHQKWSAAGGVVWCAEATV